LPAKNNNLLHHAQIDLHSTYISNKLALSIIPQRRKMSNVTIIFKPPLKNIDKFQRAAAALRFSAEFYKALALQCFFMLSGFLIYSMHSQF
jgi:hypothetical protein